MKKAILLAAGFVAGTGIANAQMPAASSVMYQQAESRPERGAFAKKAPWVRSNSTSSANKTTTGATGDWFNYADVMAIGSAAATSVYSVYPDSNVRFSTGTFLSYYGIGNSFDPTSGAYSDPNVIVNPTEKPDFVVEVDDSYRLDSFKTRIFYSRKPYNAASIVDTLQIDLVRTGSNQTFLLQYAKSAANANINAGDSIARFADATYDPIRDQLSDSIPASDRYRYRVPLNAAFFADSTADGYHNIRFAVPGGLAVNAGQKIVSYMSFKRGTTYPFGRSIDSVNNVLIETIEVNGPDTYIQQFGRDYTSFLWATRQSRYAPPYAPFEFQGHRLLIPAAAYADPTGFGIPDFSYFLRCVPCDSFLAVKDVNAGGLKNVAVVPNPANGQVEVRFVLTANADVNVTLTNLVGQVVAAEQLGTKNAGVPAAAKFNVTTLPAGIYLYTVEAAGEKRTGRLVVSH